MLRKATLLILLLTPFFLTSCFDVKEKIHLNKNGGGDYEIVMDMSGMFTNPFMKMALEEAMKNDSTMQDMEMEQDTTIRFTDIPADQKSKLSNPALWEKVVMNLNMSQSKEKFIMEMKFPFESLDDIQSFYKDMETAMGEADQNAGMAGMLGGGGSGGMMNQGGALSLKKRTLSRAPSVGDSGLSEEDLSMMEMFMDGATYQTTYILPGKVKKTTMTGAVVNGKTVTVERSLLDLMKGKVDINGDIVFKKR